MPTDSKFDNNYFRARDKIIRAVATTYYKVKTYLYNSNFDKKHFTFGIIDGKFQITSISHNDFILDTQKKLNKLAGTYDRKKFIRMALSEAINGCNFIIFSDPKDENKFVQFWTGEHKLKYNFYANKANKLKNYFLTVVGLLSEMGFVNNEVPEYRGFMVYKVDKGTDYISVDANFKNDLELAVEFTEIIYKQIYKSKYDKLVAKVE